MVDEQAGKRLFCKLEEVYIKQALVSLDPCGRSSVPLMQHAGMMSHTVNLHVNRGTVMLTATSLAAPTN